MSGHIHSEFLLGATGFSGGPSTHLSKLAGVVQVASLALKIKKARVLLPENSPKFILNDF